MKYADKGRQIGELVESKNAAYGDSFNQAHRILEVLYPNGIKPEQYSDLLATVRILDKLFRIAANPGAFGESPFADIAGYGILGAVRHEDVQCRKMHQKRTMEGRPVVVQRVDLFEPVDRTVTVPVETVDLSTPQGQAQVEECLSDSVPRAVWDFNEQQEQLAQARVLFECQTAGLYKVDPEEPF